MLLIIWTSASWCLWVSQEATCEVCTRYTSAWFCNSCLREWESQNWNKIEPPASTECPACVRCFTFSTSNPWNDQSSDYRQTWIQNLGFYHNPNKWLTASVLSVHLWNGTPNTLLVGLCEERQIRCGCKMLGAAGCLFSRRGRVQTKGVNALLTTSLRLSSPWYDKHLILVKRSFWSGFPFMQRLKDAWVTQVQLLFRLAKVAMECCSELLYHTLHPRPHHRPFSSPFLGLTEGSTFVQGLPQPR